MTINRGKKANCYMKVRGHVLARKLLCCSISTGNSLVITTMVEVQEAATIVVIVVVVTEAIYKTLENKSV